MFRDWTANAKKEFPDLNLGILDETVLVNDLIKTIGNAKEGLFDEKKVTKRKMEGYDVGYMIGFIAGNISVHWKNEYINKQSEGYKGFMALKAIRPYLEFNSLAAIKTRNIYHHLLTEDSNLEAINETISAVKIDEWLLEINETEVGNEILQVLHNKEMDYIKEYLKKETGRFLDTTIRYFTDREMTDIIQNDVAW